MFNLISKFFIAKPKNEIQPAKNKQVSGNLYLFLLAEFVRPSNRNDIDACWEKLLDEPPQKAINRFISEGLLIQEAVTDRLSTTFNQTKLRSLLKERGLPVSGNAMLNI